MQVKEIEIPAPWGHISAKVWGSDEKPPVLLLHGILDNCGSFTRLIHLLPQEFRYVCIDFPGHGKSSHFSQNQPVYLLNFLIALTIVTDYFKRESYIIVGHSFGGQISLLFGQLYPHKIQKLIMLDIIYSFPVEAEGFQHYLTTKINHFKMLEEKLKCNEVPTYTYEEALEKISNRWEYNLTREAAEALLERAIEPANDGKYKFRLDQRVANWIDPLQDLRYKIDTFRQHDISFPVLILLTKRSKNYSQFMIPLLDHFERNDRVTIKLLEGYHDVHNISPEKVAPFIVKFLLNNKL